MFVLLRLVELLVNNLVLQPQVCIWFALRTHHGEVLVTLTIWLIVLGLGSYGLSEAVRGRSAFLGQLNLLFISKSFIDLLETVLRLLSPDAELLT